MQPASQVTDTQELPRESLGGFRLLRKLGTGGMAEIYLGHRIRSTGGSQYAAVKVMLPSLVADEASVQMFLDEARITASIDHPYVCRVLDFGVDDGLPYLATEYVMGEVLSDLIEALHANPEGRIVSRSLIAQVIAQVCEGLHAAHETHNEEGKHLGIVHRDVAPQNVMVGYDGYVRVLDFGIARSTEQLHNTQHGVVKGRFAYMAPEQMESSRVDRRADVWALGVMLWEGVTGRRLFKRPELHQTMRAVMADPLPALLRSGEDIPLVLHDIIERAVVRDPRGRFSNASEMSVELSRYSSTGAPQIAAWMQRLFPGRFETKKRELRELSGVVRTMPALSTGPHPVPVQTVVSQSGIRYTTYSSGLPFRAQSSDRAPQPNTRSGWRGHRMSKAVLAMMVSAVVTGSLLMLEHAFSKPALQKERGSAHALAAASSVPPVVTPSLSADHSSKAASASEPQAVQLGLVVVRTTGGTAHVQVDGREVGMTPIRIALPEGRHQLQIGRGGDGLPVWAPVDVRAGMTHMLHIPLDE